MWPQHVRFAFQKRNELIKLLDGNKVESNTHLTTQTMCWTRHPAAADESAKERRWKGTQTKYDDVLNKGVTGEVAWGCCLQELQRAVEHSDAVAHGLERLHNEA